MAGKNQIAIIIGSRIQDERIKSGISQQQFAFNIGMSIDSIRSIESGRAKPSIESLIIICNYFGVTADYLLGRTKENSPS